MWRIIEAQLEEKHFNQEKQRENWETVNTRGEIKGRPERKRTNSGGWNRNGTKRRADCVSYAECYSSRASVLPLAHHSPLCPCLCRRTIRQHFPKYLPMLGWRMSLEWIWNNTSLYGLAIDSEMIYLAANLSHLTPQKSKRSQKSKSFCRCSPQIKCYNRISGNTYLIWNPYSLYCISMLILSPFSLLYLTHYFLTFPHRF